MRLIIVLLLGLGLVACDKKSSVDSTKDRARAEEEANGEVQKKNLAERAKKMELDLADRHFFYNAVEGEYEGDLVAGSEKYKIRFIFVRSIPPYTGNRVREISEVESDLNNLYLHMQVVQWHPEDVSSAVGCRVTGIRPNMDEGAFVVASNDCPNLYSIYLSPDGSGSSKKNKAGNLAEKIKQKVVANVSNLVGFVQPSSVSTKYSFNVRKLE